MTCTQSALITKESHEIERKKGEEKVNNVVITVSYEKSFSFRLFTYKQTLTQ